MKILKVTSRTPQSSLRLRQGVEEWGKQRDKQSKSNDKSENGIDLHQTDSAHANSRNYNLRNLTKNVPLLRRTQTDPTNTHVSPVVPSLHPKVTSRVERSDDRKYVCSQATTQRNLIKKTVCYIYSGAKL